MSVVEVKALTERPVEIVMITVDERIRRVVVLLVTINRASLELDVALPGSERWFIS